MVATGGIIYGADYNTVQAKVVRILGSGSPDGPGTALGQGLNGNAYGYNQSVTSSTVSVSAVITATQWQNLANDVNTIATHQTGSSFTEYSASYETVGKVITAADLNTLDSYMNTYVTNKLNIAATQVTKTTLITNTYPNAWGGGNAGIITSGVITFASRSALQYYFNQGGNVNIQGIASGLSNTTQNINWNTTLNSTGYVFNATSVASLIVGDVSPLLPLNSGSGNIATRVFRLQNQSGGTGTPTYTQNYTRIDANIRYDQAKIYYQVVFYDGAVVTGVPPLQAVNATTGHYVYSTKASGAFTGTDPTATTTSAWAVTTTFAP